jgi:hypothetical protein
MYILKTKTKSTPDGGSFFTYRIVESFRVGTLVKQRILLHLGKDIGIEQPHWTLLTARIDQLLQGSAPRQTEVFDLADVLGQLLETAAQRYSKLIIAKLAHPLDPASPEQDYHQVDINQLEAVQAHSIGTETLAMYAVMHLKLDQKFTALGFNKIELAAALGSIIGRMACPGSD